MYKLILDIVDWALIVLMAISILLLIGKIFYHLYALMPSIKFPAAKVNHKFCVLVPARNESAVIEGLLNSLQTQDYPKDCFDTYVIVESNEDPTIEICKNYENVTSFVRPNLDVKTKGGALDQIVKHLIQSGIAKEKQYEAYIIFDADNIVKYNFITEMNKTYDAGYEIALSYRNSKNWNGGWIASCSALTFSMVNTFANKCRARFNQNVLVSGTGFYIAARVLDELGGWPFQSLTEDAELSNFAVLNDIKGAYNENTQFYDEQPVSFRIMWNQRVRWVKGHFQVTKKYQKPILQSARTSKINRLGKLEFGINVIPLIVPIVSIILYCLITLGMGIAGAIMGVEKYLWHMAFYNFSSALSSIYIFLAVYTLVLLLVERKNISITLKNAIITVIMNPFFIILWLPVAITAFFKKEVTWTIIKHGELKKKKH